MNNFTSILEHLDEFVRVYDEGITKDPDANWSVERTLINAVATFTDSGSLPLMERCLSQIIIRKTLPWDIVKHFTADAKHVIKNEELLTSDDVRKFAEYTERLITIVKCAVIKRNACIRALNTIKNINDENERSLIKHRFTMFMIKNHAPTLRSTAVISPLESTFMLFMSKYQSLVDPSLAQEHADNITRALEDIMIDYDVIVAASDEPEGGDMGHFVFFDDRDDLQHLATDGWREEDTQFETNIRFSLYNHLVNNDTISPQKINMLKQVIDSGRYSKIIKPTSVEQIFRGMTIEQEQLEAIVGPLKQHRQGTTIDATCKIAGAAGRQNTSWTLSVDRAREFATGGVGTKHGIPIVLIANMSDNTGMYNIDCREGIYKLHFTDDLRHEAEVIALDPVTVSKIMLCKSHSHMLFYDNTKDDRQAFINAFTLQRGIEMLIAVKFVDGAWVKVYSLISSIHEKWRGTKEELEGRIKTLCLKLIDGELKYDQMMGIGKFVKLIISDDFMSRLS